MKKRMRVISLLISLALLMSATPAELPFAWAYASEAEEETGAISESVADEPEAPLTPEAGLDVPEEEAPIPPEESGTTEATAEPDWEVPLEPVAQIPDAAEEDEEEVEGTQEPAPAETADAIDYASDAGASPAFSQGYAEVLHGDTPVYESAAASAAVRAALGGGVVYVSSRSNADPDRVRISFNAGAELGIQEGWVDAPRVRPMDPASEVPAYLERCRNEDDLLFVQNFAELPLARISCAFPDATPTEASGKPAADGAYEAETVDPDAPNLMLMDGGDPMPVANAGALAATELVLTVDNVSLGVGDVFRVADVVRSNPADAADSYTYKVTSGQSYISLAADGTVTAKKAGTAKVQVTNSANQSKTLTIKVLKAAAKLSKFAIDKSTLGVGMKGKITVTFPSKTYLSYTLVSSNPDVATVAADGTVTAVTASPAPVTIFFQPTNSAKTVDGSVQVMVLPAPETVSIVASKTTLGVGEKGATVTGVCPEGTLCDFKYSSSNSEVVSVDASTGALTLKKAEKDEKVTITAKANNSSAKAEIELTVLPAPELIDFTNGTLTLGKGDTHQLTEMANGGIIKLKPENAGASYTYKSNKTSVATVSATGMITAKKAGTAKVRVTAQNGVYKELTVKVQNAPSSVKLSASELKMGVHSDRSLTVSFNKKDVYSVYSFTSSDENIVRVDRYGNLTALQATEAGKPVSITVETQNGKSASCAVTVLPAPETVSVVASKTTLGVGEKGATVMGVCPDGTMCDFKYSSSNDEVVSVDEATGALTLKKQGKATITAKANNSSAKAEIELTVLPAPESIDFTNGTLTLGKGDTYQLVEMSNGGIIHLTPADASASYTYKSSKTSVATVSATGLITAKKTGTAKIRVTTQDEKVYRELTVKVQNAPSSVKLSASALTLGARSDRSLTVSFNKKDVYSSYTFASSDESVVRVDRYGNLTTQGVADEKTATITVTTQNGKSASCAVTVLPAPETVSAVASKATLGVGEKGATVQGECPAGTLCDFAYTSSNADVATVDASTGALTLKKQGKATITVQANNSNAKAEIELTVLPAPESITFVSGGTLKIGNKDTYQLAEVANGGIIQLDPANASASYTYKSTKTNIATVSATGLITAKKTGTAKIRVTAQNGVYKELTVQVCTAPTSVKLSADPEQIGLGARGKLVVSFNSAKAYSDCTYVSDNPDVVEVLPDGTFVAKALTGEKPVTVTVTTKNGKTASCTISVLAAPDTVRLAHSEYALSSGGMTLNLMDEVITPPNTLASFTFSTSNHNVVEFDASGVLKTVGAGTAAITVSTQNKDVFATAKVNVSAEPVRAAFAGLPAQLNISKGDELSLPAPVAYDAFGNAVPATFSYKSSNAKIAKISGNALTAVKASSSTVTITATTHNGKKATIKVRVYANAISGVELDHSNYEFYIRDGYTESIALNGAVTGTNLNYGSIAYTTSDPAVATVSASGVVTAVGTGSATITATSKNGKAAYCSVTVYRLSSTLRFAESAAGLTMGETEKYTLAPIFDEGCSAKLTYGSSNAACVSVDAQGVLTANAPGTATITAVGPNGLRAQVEVTVMYSPTGVFLPASRVSLKPDERISLRPTLTSSAEPINDRVRYGSSDTSVATVSNDGTVEAVAAGRALITVTACNGLSAECEVIVGDGAGAASLGWSGTAAMAVGGSADLALTLNSEALAQGYEVTSSNPAALQIDNNASMTAQAAADRVEVTLRVGGREVSTAYVKVYASVTPVFEIDGQQAGPMIELGTAAYSEATGENCSFALRGLPEEPLLGDIDVEISDPEMLTYDAEARTFKTAEKAGTCTVTAAIGAQKATLEVVVAAAPVYRALLISEYNGVGGKNQLPFAQSNIDNVAATLAQSNIGGQRYDTVVTRKNPSESAIKSAITSTFAGATANDVSLIYVVAHGHQGSGSMEGQYCFSMDGYSTKKTGTYITDTELMSWIQASDAIKGRVVLVLDSCYSGRFISHQSGNLSAMDNFAVITAQVKDKPASYYVHGGGYTEPTFEFFTRKFCEGLGHDQVSGSVAPAADDDMNGMLTVNEAFAYAIPATADMVNQYKAYGASGGNGFICGSWQNRLGTYFQEPQTRIPDAMQDLVIVGLGEASE